MTMVPSPTPDDPVIFDFARYMDRWAVIARIGDFGFTIAIFRSKARAERAAGDLGTTLQRHLDAQERGNRAN